MAICKFGEEILQTIVNMYESKGGRANKKTVRMYYPQCHFLGTLLIFIILQEKIIDFLLIVMEAHHPGGVGDRSERAYAYNWESWKKSLKQLNFVTIREIGVLQKQGTVTENFLKLVVEIYNQVNFCYYLVREFLIDDKL